jgi:hypothetical protein
MELTLDEITKIAKPEGWAIFECVGSSDGDYQLERIDSDNKFESDSEAIKHVVKLALNGSAFHKQVLIKLIELNPNESNFIIKSILL